MLGFMLQVLKELDVFNQTDIDNAVKALDEEVCAFLSPMHFGEEWNFCKVISSVFGRSGFALEILPY
jgi:hypothetical protein